MGLRLKYTKIETVKITLINEENSDPEPEVYYLLPSGYKDSAIEVYESAYEQLEIQLVHKQKLTDALSKADKKN